ncbi:helix-turn-helix domain-containing protein [Enterococcus dispar]|uniref:helix-turn-helix domain-containing protein n=1 Tax=Enterococcus dispar TaxID=44009 RepID=UPI00189F336D|nr:helix-turn-helix transcriptional regulator [Enterococcus dispar]
MTLIERIKEAAKNRGIHSLAEIERQTGISNGQIRRWDTSSPKIDNIQKVAELLGVSTDYLLGRTDNPNLPESEDVNNKSLAKKVMMRMNTEGLSEEDILGVEKEIEKFFAWRIEEIRRENENKQ